MRLTWKHSTLAAASALLSWSAYAADFSAADALFALRGNGTAATAAARSAYDAMLPSLSGQELVYAVSHMAQLDIYAGEILIPKAEKETRRNIFKRCFDELMPKINPELVGLTPNYFYWRGICLAFWGEASSLVERLAKVGEIKKMLAGGLAADTRYYGGGIMRLSAGVTSNPMSRAIGLYDPEGGLAKLNAALEASNFPGEANAGAQVYANHRYKVETLIELNRKAEALELTNAAIEEIEYLQSENSLPAGIEPETLWELNRLQDLKTRLGQ